MAQNVLSCKLLDLGWLSQGKYDSQFAFLFYSFLSQLRVTVGDGVLKDLHPALTVQPLYPLCSCQGASLCKSHPATGHL